MTIAPTPIWEQKLISLAHEARRPHPLAGPIPIRDRALLARAYTHCRAVTAAHSRSFHLASGFLPHRKRSAIRALYAFCRVTDDIVDCPGCEAESTLHRWRSHALAVEPPMEDLVAVAWADARSRYGIPLRYAEQLINGVAQDLRPVRYHTFEDLAAYAYGVASTVGLMSMHIVGFSSPHAIPYAIKLGVALQLTNILRDVGEDWRAGRLYLPLDELSAYGLRPQDIAGGQVDDRWRAFMRFQIARARRLYAEAWPGIRLLHPDGRFAVAAAGDLYRAILDDVQAHDYDVFTRRASVSTAGKLRRLPGVWRSLL